MNVTRTGLLYGPVHIGNGGTPAPAKPDTSTGSSNPPSHPFSPSTNAGNIGRYGR